MTFGEKLRELRKAAGLSVSALGRILNPDSHEVGRVAVTRMERGVYEPNLDVARQIVRALGASLAVFDDTEKPEKS